MKKSKVAGLLLAILFAVSTPQAEAALSASWTLEVSQELEGAQLERSARSADRKQSLQAMREKGIQFVDGNPGDTGPPHLPCLARRGRRV